MGEFSKWSENDYKTPHAGAVDSFDESPLETVSQAPDDQVPKSAGERETAGETHARETSPKPRKRREGAPAVTTEQFTGALQPLQVKLPQDLIQSLKLHSIQSGKTMSELVLEYLTTGEVLSKAWVATRQAG